MGPRARKSVASRKTIRDQVARKERNSMSAPVDKAAEVPSESQQRILDVFVQAFPSMNSGDDFKSTLQTVKGHLFDRNFQAAFAKREYLEVYAVRWSSARALAYTDIFTQESRRSWFRSLAVGEQETQTPPCCIQNTSEEKLDARVSASSASSTVNVACIGGGAGAELVALAYVSRKLSQETCMNICAIDIADWRMPLQSLYNALTTAPTLSDHASQAVKEANSASIDPGKLSVQFVQSDILDPESVQQSFAASKQYPGPDDPSKLPVQAAQESAQLFSNMDVVTIMFTLNELFTASPPQTTDLLLRLTDTMRTGSHLVVVDSPGSYSEVQLGKTGGRKQYPMAWLLDYALLQIAGEGKWKKIEEEPSLWFRLDDRGRHLKYPIALENCRYQLHVYQKR